MGIVSEEYSKKMSDGTNCKYTFTIETENICKNAQEILHNLPILSKSAYINLGNKMVYGSADQNEIENSKEHPPNVSGHTHLPGVPEHASGCNKETLRGMYRNR